MSDELKLESSWEEVKELLKEVNYHLTDDDLDYKPGHAGILLNRLAGKLDRSPDEIRKWIESVSSNKGKAS